MHSPPRDAGDEPSFQNRAKDAKAIFIGGQLEQALSHNRAWKTFCADGLAKFLPAGDFDASSHDCCVKTVKVLR
jgi:hypothetical protein